MTESLETSFFYNQSKKIKLTPSKKIFDPGDQFQLFTMQRLVIWTTYAYIDTKVEQKVGLVA